MFIGRRPGRFKWIAVFLLFLHVYFILDVFMLHIITSSSDSQKSGKKSNTLVDSKYQDFDFVYNEDVGKENDNPNIDLKMQERIKNRTKKKRVLGKLNSKLIMPDDASLIHQIKTDWIDEPSYLEYKLKSGGKAGLATEEITQTVDDLLKHKTGGFFVEVGAYNGETDSPTLHFECERGWSGLLVEADPLNYQYLQNGHRKAHSINACAGINTFPELVRFKQDGAKGQVTRRSDQRPKSNVHAQDKTVEVQCFSLYSMLLGLGHTKIDYLSININGGEDKILKTIPYHKIVLSIISVNITHLNDDETDSLVLELENQGLRLHTGENINFSDVMLFVNKELLM